VCGIVGYLDRAGAGHAPIGSVLLRMLAPLGDRGPDSAGVALFRKPDPEMVLRIKLGEAGDLRPRAKAVLSRIEEAGIAVTRSEASGPYLRLAVSPETPLDLLTEAVEGEGAHGPDAREIISAGRCLEIVKQVGSPAALEASCGISGFHGTHGIGHTRLSTESRVDLSHSQPFWAHGTPDLAVVHNGHITNYHRLRRIYEQEGIRFHTENDSEIIGLYLGRRIARGDTLEEAMRASLAELDGSFCYLAAAPGVLAFAKDPYCLKPLIVAETEDWVAVATEEVALRQAHGEAFTAFEPAGRALHVWQVGQPALAAA
jgi:methylamine---glutamate N-methyltransferase subunit A